MNEIGAAFGVCFGWFMLYFILFEFVLGPMISGCRMEHNRRKQQEEQEKKEKFAKEQEKKEREEYERLKKKFEGK